MTGVGNPAFVIPALASFSVRLFLQLHSGVDRDNVYIGPNTCIVENVVIGDNVTIGAGSVVTKSIPENATAAGNYAKVLSYNKLGRYIRQHRTNNLLSATKKSRL